ncbi:MAG: cardiolipin synthase ClsB, partial [Betaproteobacteria bacterium]|nr:cardiolipin synthase ClsB [Betaproteobacteria bacterium]
YRAAVRSAHHRVLIANAYFFPGYRLLPGPAPRGQARRCQVVVLQNDADLPWVQRASGIAAFSYLPATRRRARLPLQRAPLHAKVAVVDDRWATVGSNNLDPTSLS